MDFMTWINANSGTAVAALALLFTVGSWWWLHARRGRLKVADIHNFSGWVTSEELSVRLPLLFENTGARPRVVRYLRLTWGADDGQVVRAEAHTMFPTLRTVDSSLPEGQSEYFHAFAVPAFGVLTTYPAFRVKSPPITPGSPVRVELEELVPRGWKSLGSFDLHTEVLSNTFLTVSNLEEIWPAGFADNVRQYQESLLEKMARRELSEANDQEA